uniref:28S ribosomal protein S18c, mitochondrial n=1 Tax=Globodera pallida TaxID=36090 RepID=A0A183CC40_GLOPA
MLTPKPNVLFIPCRFMRKARNSLLKSRPATACYNASQIDFGEVRSSLLKVEQAPDDNAKQLFPADPDAPVQLGFNPFERADRKCLLCALGIRLDYKNARLLQQFVSNFSGRVYDQHVTGLCSKQYKTLLATIAHSRKAGYMPVLVKDAKYLRDPKLFDPLKAIRPHSYD